MRFATIMWIITVWFGFKAAAASAQTFEDGYQSYVRNQFPVAELQFKGALKKAKTDEDKAFIQKFIGICQYMRGDKKNANISFTAALRLDGNVAIDEEEVLDPGVVPFFNSIKKVIASKPREVAKTPPPAPTPKAAPIAPKSSFATKKQGAPVPKAPPKGKGKNKALVSESAMGLPDDTLVAEKGGGGGFKFLHLLPFGTGQFVNGSPILGSLFAGAEVGALYVFMDADKTIKEREGLNSVVATKEGLSDQQREEFYAQNNTFISSVKTQKNLALTSFLLLWGGGVAEAIIRAPNPGKKLGDYRISPEIHDGKSSYVLHWQKNF